MKRNYVIKINKIGIEKLFKAPNKKSKLSIYSNSNKKRKIENKKLNLKTLSINSTIHSSLKNSNSMGKRHSLLMSDINKNPSASLLKQIEDKEREAEIRLLIKKRNYEIQNLAKERRKLKKISVMTRETYSLRILSTKIMHINNRINKLIKLNDSLIVYPDEYEKQTNKKKKKRNFSYDFDSNDINFPLSMKGDFKKINNNLKINRIKQYGKIIDLSTVIENIIDKPSFYFQREKENKLFTPSTEYCGNQRKLGKTTIYLKSFKPKSFTSRNLNLNNNNNDQYCNTLEDLFYEIEENNKRNDTNIYKTINSFSNNKTNDTEKNYFRISSVRPTTCESDNDCKKSNFNKFNCSLKKQSIKNSTSQNLNSKVNKVLNDTKVIKESINNAIREDDKEKNKKDNERVLLKLANKLLKKHNKLSQRKYINKKQTLEEQYIEKLKAIPNTVKEEFRDCFKKILFQNRILNKSEPNKENIYEQRIKYLKEQKKIQRETLENMYILKENIFTGKEDQQVFKEEMVFDNYGNINSLEWLIKKHHVLDNSSKFVGAYNPKEKLNLCIHYPEDV
jgi:hypothetical protein